MTIVLEDLTITRTLLLNVVTKGFSLLCNRKSGSESDIGVLEECFFFFLTEIIINYPAIVKMAI